MAVPEIGSDEGLERWLEGKPVDWAQAIAARAALRVLPLTFPSAEAEKPGKTDPRVILLQSFRAMFISWAASKYPAHNMSAAAAAASSFAAAASYASSAASAASFAAAFADADCFAAAADAASYASSAASASYPAYAASSASRAAAFADAAWRALSADCAWLEESGDNGRLIDQPVWLIDVRGDKRYLANLPSWTRAPLDAFAKSDMADTSWRLILDWYRAILPNTQDAAPRSLFGEAADVALATQPDDFWTIIGLRTPDRIIDAVAEVVGWAKHDFWPVWDFFISFTKDDAEVARRISNVLEQERYLVFSQFNDITAGKSFVREMNRGLEGMGQLIAVYSPSYFDSGPCQAEWEAAFTFDPSGEKGKIVPFMVRPCTPTPLARRLIWTPLLGLSPEAERQAILAAVRGGTTPRDRVSQRVALREAISPDVVSTASGRSLDVASNPVTDVPFVDIDLTELPQYLRTIIETALDALAGKNCPSGLRRALTSYAEELDARGINCMTGVLRGQMDFIEAEIDDRGADDWLTGAGLRKSLDNLRKAHARLLAHYPLDQTRERLFRAIEIDASKLEGEEFAELEREIARAVESAYEDETVTEQYRTVSANRRRVTRDILDLRTPQVPAVGDADYIRREADRARRVEDAKKRALAQQVGFADKSLDVLSKMTTVADSPSTARLAMAFGRLLDWFW